MVAICKRLLVIQVWDQWLIDVQALYLLVAASFTLWYSGCAAPLGLDAGMARPGERNVLPFFHMNRAYGSTACNNLALLRLMELCEKRQGRIEVEAKLSPCGGFHELGISKCNLLERPDPWQITWHSSTCTQSNAHGEKWPDNKYKPDFKSHNLNTTERCRNNKKA